MNEVVAIGSVITLDEPCAVPELPEVETVVRTIAPVLAGRRFTRTTLHRRDIVHGNRVPFQKTIVNREITRVTRRAKRIVITFDETTRLIFHLGMSGRMSLDKPGADIEAHTHFQARISDSDVELRFRDPRRFGGIWLLSGSRSFKGRQLGDLGPEPLEIRATDFAKLTRRKRPIKSLLLDQTVIAGLGNIYCDESLHDAGLHPVMPAWTLDRAQTGQLCRSIKKVLRKAINFKGTTLIDYRTAEGEVGGFRKYHRVYQREGRPCRTCGCAIERITLAGRSTFFCPCCQPVISTGRAP
ncbi:MAG: bifunctional DNA-formamidopyrimidine glycosylase/DNA-(apurinic or apyrimidinic site) lyase [Planctomycetota bacterium]|jgi:formamidopyrimidine-DNA glycosylase